MHTYPEARKYAATLTLRDSLGKGSLSWEVRSYHNGDHWHPYLSGTGNDLTFTAPPPEDLLSTGAGNYLQIRLTATDSKGLSRTVVQKMDPKQVNVRFVTRPVDLKLEVSGRVFSAPRTLLSWEGYKLNVYAPRQRHVNVGVPILVRRPRRQAHHHRALGRHHLRGGLREVAAPITAALSAKIALAFCGLRPSG
ncbi:MAG: hypothetical protein M3P70_00045 [Actinomycetota bacterium]|nr:hypothetical protein [Actinomycetota bacterium]